MQTPTLAKWLAAAALTTSLHAGLDDPARGGMYRLTRADFYSGALPKPFNSGLGALDGLDFAGTRRLDTIVRGTNEVVVTPIGGTTTYSLTLDRKIALDGPADIAVHRMADGTYLLLIPELSPLTPNRDDNPVTVVRLPADF